MAGSSPSPTISGSTCTLKTAQATHLFKIDGYSLCRGLGVGKSMNSGTFAVGGYDWCLLFYPDGDRGDTEDRVSAFLQLKTEDAEVRALYDLRLVGRTTTPVSTWPDASKAEPSVFDNRDGFCTAHGYRKFEKKSLIEEYLVDDALIIQCNKTVINLTEHLMDTADIKIITDVQVPLSDLADNLSGILEATEGADVSFKVHGEVFPAHKIILAMRSPVFKADFYGPMRDEGRCSITVQDMNRHLLVAADRYAMERMKLMCERRLCLSFTAQSVATTLALADQHNCSQLKDACIEFINSPNRMNDVVASKGYKHLKRACPTLFVDIWEGAAKARKI